MKILRLVLLLLLSGPLFASTEALTTSDPSVDARVIGIWQEYEPSAHVVQFFPDHSVRLYLTQEAGGALGMHWISGSWRITPASVLVLDMTANDQSLHSETRLTFRGDEMVLIDEDNVETRHRKLIGGLPAKYQW